MSYAANHDTNARDATDGQAFFVDEAPAPDGTEEELALERWEQFHEAVEKLPEELREVFKLVWYLGVDQKTAADTLGCSQRTVGRRWQDTRELVAKALDEDEGDGSVPG